MVKKSLGIEKGRVTNAGISDIVTHIRQAEKEGRKFITDELTEQLKGRTNKETAKNIWSFIRSNIQYLEDGEHQKTQSPGALWSSRVGDCKSMTVFGASILQKMCIPYDLIIDFYTPGNANNGHIYVRLKDGTILDPVNSKFNAADKAWKRVKIPGHKICGANIAGKVNPKKMSSISSYIEGRANVAEPIAVPGSFINYSQLTDGELSVKLVARQNELFYLATGKEVYKKNQEALNQLVGNSLSGTPIKTQSRLSNWAQSKIASNTMPAITAYYFSPLFQRDRAKVGQLYTFDEYRQSEYDKCVDLRLQWAKTSRLRFSERAKLRRQWENCFESVRYLGLINDQMESSGAHLLYNFAETNINPTIQTKRVLHRIAVDNYSRVFGLSTENISLWLRNGVIAENIRQGAGAMSPEESILFLQKNIPDNYDKIGAVLEVLTIILKVITVALAATQMILSRINDVEKQRLIANTQGLGTKAFGPEKEDFLQSVQSTLSEQGLTIPIAVLAAVLFLE